MNIKTLYEGDKNKFRIIFYKKCEVFSLERGKGCKDSEIIGTKWCKGITFVSTCVNSK